MEKELIKLTSQLSVLAIAAWVVFAALGKTKTKTRAPKSDPTQFAQSSRVWFASPVSAPAAEIAMSMPQAI